MTQDQGEKGWLKHTAATVDEELPEAFAYVLIIQHRESQRSVFLSREPPAATSGLLRHWADTIDAGKATHVSGAKRPDA